MEQAVQFVVDFIRDNPVITAGLLTGGLAPFITKLLDALIDVPIVRRTVRGVMEAAAISVLGVAKTIQGFSFASGKVHSTLLIKWLPNGVGKALENSLQRFVEELILQPMEAYLPRLVGLIRWLLITPYYRGLDADDGTGSAGDVGTTLVQAAELAVLETEKASPRKEGDDPGVRTAQNRTKHATARSKIVSALGDAAERVGEAAIDAAIKNAVPRVKHLFGALF